MAAEYIGAEHSEWYLLGEARLNDRLKGTARFEHLRGDERRLIAGPTIAIAKQFELKLEGVFSNKKIDGVRAQIAIRW